VAASSAAAASSFAAAAAAAAFVVAAAAAAAAAFVAAAAAAAASSSAEPFVGFASSSSVGSCPSFVGSSLASCFQAFLQAFHPLLLLWQQLWVEQQWKPQVSPC